VQAGSGRPTVRAMTDNGWTRVDLGLGAYLLYEFSGPTTIEFQLWWETVELGKGTIDESNPSAQVKFEEDFVRADLDLSLQPFLGQVLASGDVQSRTKKTDPWKTISQWKDAVLFLFDPTKGMIAGSPSAYAPVVDPRWGPSGPSGGDGVTRFHLTDDVRAVTDVGPQVKQRMFPGYHPMVLNIVACCGRPLGAPDGPGVYGDPTSIWFNVFFGVYQMDCALADGWTRPFGYQGAAGIQSVVRGEDLVRVGKADWNWLSNFMYGVPGAVCEEYSSVDMSKVKFTPTATTKIGTTQWHYLTMSGVQVASGYESDAPGAGKLVENSILTDEWRRSFGEPSPKPGYPTSFIPTVLQSTLVMAYWKDDTAFHTLMFGGTSGVGSDAAFLRDQIQGAKVLIGTRYPGSGFPI
jgi:hypothetical protein